MAKHELRLGLAGLGFASTLTLPDMIRHQRFVITAAADPRTVARMAFERDLGGQAFESVEALCACPDVDVVYISTPSALHLEHAVAAARAGKHVVVEKPMALSVDACTEMIAAADEAGVALIYGHTHCYDPPIRAMRAVVDAGTHGALRMVHNATYSDYLYRARADWELDTTIGGGAVFNQAPHQIDIVRMLIGAPLESVHAHAYVLDSERPTEGAFIAQLSFQGGAAASLVFSGYGRFDVAALHHGVGEDGFPRDPAAHARNHVARIGREEVSARDARRFGIAGLAENDPPHQPFFGLTVASLERADLRQSPNGVLLYDAEGTSEIDVPLRPTGREIMLDEIYRCVAEGATARHDGRWGRETAAACIGILESSATGEPVTIGPCEGG